MADARFFAAVQRNALARHKVTQEQLAAACGVEQSSISHRMSGRRAGSETSLESTAAGLGISERQLLLEELDPKRAAESAASTSAAAREVRVLAKVIKGVRLSLGLSQTEFARKTGMHLSSIVKFERGREATREATLEALAAGLGWTVRKFVLRGLLYDAAEAPAVAEVDQDAIRARYVAAIDGRKVKGIEVAKKVGVVRSSLTRFYQGKRVSDELAQSIDAALAKVA